MWTTVGTKKNVARRADVPLRLVLSSCPWTPQYWHVRHRAVIDMQRQCGNASLFRTRAPYEMTFPYHEWVMHEQRTAGRSRMHLAGAETLHMAHVLLELDKAFISGSRRTSSREDRLWQEHLLGPKWSKDVQTVANRMTRLEFQDGKRKKVARNYHGRGTTHSHSLDFLKNLKEIGLEHKISAHLPSKETHPFLHGLVMDGQRDRSSSKLPVRHQDSEWDEDTQKVLLKHTKEDQDLHLRAYFPQTMEITKCHEDVQQPDGNGAVLRYVATYAMKFSDSMDKEWLNDHASDYSVARRILFSYHPLEPEMWLSLAQERFPQVDYKGTLIDFFVPLPGVEVKPKLLKNYEEASWRGRNMSFLQFLRKSNANGGILRHIKEKHAQHVQDALTQMMISKGYSTKEAAAQSSQLVRSFKQRTRAGENLGSLVAFVKQKFGEAHVVELERFANECQPEGEKLVAAGMYSMLNDRYYGQWLVLHHPFKLLEDLTSQMDAVLSQVPNHYRYFTMALQANPQFWTDDVAIRHQMELEANSRAMVESILNKVRAQRSLIRSYLNGELAPGDDISPTQSSTEPRVSEVGANRPKLTLSQKKLRDIMKPLVQRSLDATRAVEEEEIERLVAAATASNKMLFASGPPGTGKTFVVHQQIQRWQSRGARILFALPTGQLAAEMRARHPNVDIDTYHGGLLFHKELSESLGIFTQYDLIVLDEAPAT